MRFPPPTDCTNRTSKPLGRPASCRSTRPQTLMQQLAAVIGSPVRHSLSPAIHNAAFAHHGDAWVYLAFEVQPQHAAAAVDAMRVLGISGLSVTMPHKEMVLGALDDLSDDARLVGAANTVVRDSSGRRSQFASATRCVATRQTQSNPKTLQRFRPSSTPHQSACTA
ncbi:MAG: hypothetical protein EBT17_00435 [Actinobacteria bacterium]|nr:hypothetical protein [Actinomycetota bacterium]